MTSTNIWANFLSSDETLKKITAEADNPNWLVDSDLHTELSKYMLTAEDVKRTWKVTLPDDFNDPKNLEKLIKCLQVTQSFRDRVLEIKLSLIPTKRSLEKLMERVEAHVLINYFDEINEFRNQTERSRVMRSLIPALINNLEDYEQLIKTCEMVMENLKDTHFTLVEIERIATILLDFKKATNKY